MNKKYKFYAVMTCLMFIAVLLVVVMILDIIMHLGWQLVLSMTLFCAACIPLWLILGDVLTQYYEAEAKRRNRRKLIVIPYTVPTKSEAPIQFKRTDPDSDIKVYKNKSGNIELRRIITASDLEADTQIYSIKKTK